MLLSSEAAAMIPTGRISPNTQARSSSPDVERRHKSVQIWREGKGKISAWNARMAPIRSSFLVRFPPRRSTVLAEMDDPRHDDVDHHQARFWVDGFWLQLLGGWILVAALVAAPWHSCP